MSFHLKELDRAGLLHATRDGRYVRYAVHVEGMRRLLAYLTEDCCQGRPELCGASLRGGCRCLWQQAKERASERAVPITSCSCARTIRPAP